MNAESVGKGHDSGIGHVLGSGFSPSGTDEKPLKQLWLHSGNQSMWTVNKAYHIVISEPLSYHLTMMWLFINIFLHSVFKHALKRKSSQGYPLTEYALLATPEPWKHCLTAVFMIRFLIISSCVSKSTP